MSQPGPTAPHPSLEALFTPILSGGILRSDRGDGPQPFPTTPQTGFDRNQTLRRLLSLAGENWPLERSDPCLEYSFEGGVLLRPGSVEGWIESCSQHFPLEPIREFWEEVWNLSVCAWNFIDLLGVEPWKPPRAGFPLATPSFWQGASRYRRLFDSIEAFVDRCGLGYDRRFGRWMQGEVELAYGLPWERVPLGMAALALNAPSESYRLARGKQSPAHGLLPGESDSGSSVALSGVASAFQVGFEHTPSLRDSEAPVRSIRIESLEGLLWGDSAILAFDADSIGRIFFRLREPLPGGELTSVLESAMVAMWGNGWGSIRSETLQKLDNLSYRPHPDSPPLRLEPEWPWIGAARAAHRILEANRTALGVGK